MVQTDIDSATTERRAITGALIAANAGGGADGVADSVDLSLVGQNLTLTVGRTVGADLTDTQALPAAPDASHTARGIVELATGVETIAGTDTVRAATPV